jgi:flagellar biosynthetic protein FlhB
MLAALLSQGASACLLLVVAAIVVGVGAGALQAGLRISLQPLSPNWNRLNPFLGWQRLLSTKSWVRMAMTAGKGVLAAVIGYGVIRADAPRWMAAGSLPEAVVAAWQSGLRLAIGLSLALLALAAIDYLFQRWKHEADLRMTRQELIEERRSDEGDPHIRARMRRLLREAAQNRTLQDVPAATAVIRNPTHFAVAIRYQRGVTPAPVVVAKGHGAFARRIIDCAERHGVPVLRRPPLARALYAMADVGQEIPADLYHAVAEILAFVYGRSR